MLKSWLENIWWQAIIISSEVRMYGLVWMIVLCVCMCMCVCVYVCTCLYVCLCTDKFYIDFVLVFKSVYSQGQEMTSDCCIRVYYILSYHNWLTQGHMHTQVWECHWQYNKMTGWLIEYYCTHTDHHGMDMYSAWNKPKIS